MEASRALYAAKLARADATLRGLPGYAAPQAGFFLWLDVGDGETAALRLWRETGVRVLPGAYLGRATPRTENPGRPYIRVALVAELDEAARGLDVIAEVLQPQLAERV